MEYVCKTKCQFKGRLYQIGDPLITDSPEGTPKHFRLIDVPIPEPEEDHGPIVDADFEADDEREKYRKDLKSISYKLLKKAAGTTAQLKRCDLIDMAVLEMFPEDLPED